MSKKNVVVFDFDGTLTSHDTFIAFSCHAFGKVRFAFALLQAFPWLLLWKTGVLKGGDAKRRLYSILYKGKKKVDILNKSKTFNPKYRKDIQNILARHKKEGATVYIITASLDLWMEEIRRQLGVNVICTHTSTDSDGILDGKFSTPNCHGEEKTRRLKESETEPFFLTVYGDEPEGGDASLFKMADVCHQV